MKKIILIVDDLPPNLYMLEIVLTSNDFEVVKASNGMEALDIAREHPIDLVISDILMPKMDGFVLCRTWKSDEQLRKIPFIFYTATYTDYRDEQFALSLGAERFLIKPMEMNELIKVVLEVLENASSERKPDDAGQPEKEDAFYREYTHALVRKLEDKMIQIERSNLRLSALYQASSALHLTRTISEMVSIILRSIVDMAGFHFACYYTIQPSSSHLRLQDSRGLLTDSSLLPDIFNMGDLRNGFSLAASRRQMVIYPDEVQLRESIPPDSGMRSILYIPVQYETHLFGVLGIFSEQLSAFREEEQHDLMVLANTFATSIENANNQEEVRKQLARIWILHNIDLVITSNLELEGALNAILPHVQSSLKCDAAAVLGIRQNSKEFHPLTGYGFRMSRPKDMAAHSGLAHDMANTGCQGGMISELPVTAAFTRMCASEEFQTYHVIPLVVKEKVSGLLEVFHRDAFSPDHDWIEFFETIAGQVAIAIDNASMFGDLQHSNEELSVAYDATIRGWSRAMDLRDRETEGHTQRVTDMVVRLAKKMGINEEEIVHIRRGALLHDIGKLGVPDGILLKPDRLTEDEWVLMRQHPQFAYDMLLPIDYLYPALDIPYCHHEKWDGTGYPRGLKGEEIPLAARMFAIIDVWDALRSDRTYRKAWREEDVLVYLQDQAGRHFDPIVVENFMTLLAMERGVQDDPISFSE